MDQLTVGAHATQMTFKPEASPALLVRIERAKAGDVVAPAELFRDHGADVFRPSMRLTGSRADAEDVAQDVFLRLPSAMGGFHGTTENSPGWIGRLAVRQALMHLRAGRRRARLGFATLPRSYRRETAHSSDSRSRPC